MPEQAAGCPFCLPPPERLLIADEFGLALLDGFPVTEGHALVVPRKHVSSLFDLPAAERATLWSLAGRVRDLLREKFRPDGFNVGLNDGAAAGQTVAHAHIHVIPRRFGDSTDPRGGVRWIIPDKARYW